MSNSILVLPSDKFLTYLLELPDVKEKYISSTIQFLLKQTYPGNISETIIDYRITGNKVICTLITKEKYKSLPQSVQIFSPFYYFSQISKDGTYICESQGKNYIAVIQNGTLEKIETRYQNESDSDIYRLNTFHYSFDQIIKNETGNKQITRKAAKNSFLYQPIEKRTKKKIMISSYVLSILFLICINFIAFKTDKKAKEEAIAAKTEYEQLRLNTKENKTTEVRKIYADELPIQEIIFAFYNADKNLKIKNLYISSNNYRVECENSKALGILEKIKNSELLKNAVLKQSYVDSNGKEHFYVSGELND